jgi:hypothetical protein
VCSSDLEADYAIFDAGFPILYKILEVEEPWKNERIYIQLRLDYGPHSTSWKRGNLIYEKTFENSIATELILRLEYVIQAEENIGALRAIWESDKPMFFLRKKSNRTEAPKYTPDEVANPQTAKNFEEVIDLLAKVWSSHWSVPLDSTLLGIDLLAADNLFDLLVRPK